VQGGTEHGSLIAHQMMDVAIRVETIRPFATQQMAVLIENCNIFTNSSSVCEVLFAAAWICGEFSEHLPDRRSIMLALLPSARFPSHIEAAFIHNSAKLFVEVALQNIASEEPIDYKDAIADKLSGYLLSEDLEVQERASNFLQLLQQSSLWHESLFKSNPLNPVAAKAQKKVPIPPGLDLDVPFVVIEPEKLPVDDKLGFAGEDEEEDEGRKKKGKRSKKSKKGKENDDGEGKKKKKKKKEGTDGKKEKKTKKEADEKDRKSVSKVEVAEEAVIAASPVKKPLAPVIPGLASSNNFVVSKEKKTKKKKKVNGKEEVDEPEVEAEPQHVVTIKGLEMPEGAQDDDLNSDDDISSNDPHKALSKVVLDQPVVTPSPPPDTARNAIEKTDSGKKSSKTKKHSKRSNAATNGTTDGGDGEAAGQKTKKGKSGKKSKKSKEVTAPQREDYEETMGGTSENPSPPSPPSIPSQPVILLQNDSISVAQEFMKLDPHERLLKYGITVTNKGQEELFELKLTWKNLPDGVTVNHEKEMSTSIIPADSELLQLGIKFTAPSEIKLEGQLEYRVLVSLITPGIIEL
jgi:AP-3 complex subunit delta-1